MKVLKFLGLLGVILIVFGLVLWWFFNQPFGTGLISPLGSRLKENLPLKEYSFEELRKRDYPGSEIKLEEIIKEEEKYTSWLFSYLSDGKKITGMANIPAPRNPPAGGVVGVIVMLRGYADDSVYFTGLGTRKAAGFFAENGFITLAPDFLGFGTSDSPSADILEARFYRPVEVLNLLASVKSLSRADPERVFLWAHSNGGQIALSVLEISQRPIPTTLWAPVTKGFPESVLVFMGPPAGGDDLGKKVKKAIDEFVKKYDSKKYSIDHYFAEITAPIQVHQGMADPLIPTGWSDDFVDEMKRLEKKVIYYQYPGNDHNLKQSWDKVVERDLMFFQSFL
ncbi:MAG TPA: alpha/beta fold hydrolase [Nevskiaceae bacterium]|nr:alpha/beta fold hydrolase [Nevskiaceae bacterium]